MTRESWSSADHYEPFMGRWSRLLAAEVVSWLAAPAGLRWLDVGCGTGALSEAVLIGADPAWVVGVDPSPAYLAGVAARIDDPRLTFRVGDAASLPVPDASVDRVMCGLVLNFVPDAVAAVRDIGRVLAPGGVAAAYVWDYPGRMQMLRLFWDAVVALDREAASLDEAVRFPICVAGGLERCFADAGLTVRSTRPIDVPTVFSDFDDYWMPFLGGQGPGPGYCATLPDDALVRLRERLRETLPTEPDGSIHLTARAWSVTGGPVA